VEIECFAETRKAGSAPRSATVEQTRIQVERRGERDVHSATRLKRGGGRGAKGRFLIGKWTKPAGERDRPWR